MVVNRGSTPLGHVMLIETDWLQSFVEWLTFKYLHAHWWWTKNFLTYIYTASARANITPYQMAHFACTQIPTYRHKQRYGWRQRCFQIHRFNVIHTARQWGGQLGKRKLDVFRYGSWCQSGVSNRNIAGRQKGLIACFSYCCATDATIY